MACSGRCPGMLSAQAEANARWYMHAVLLLCLRHMPFDKDVNKHYFWVLVLMASARSNKRRKKDIFEPFMWFCIWLVIRSKYCSLILIWWSKEKKTMQIVGLKLWGCSLATCLLPQKVTAVIACGNRNTALVSMRPGSNALLHCVALITLTCPSLSTLNLNPILEC